MGRRMGGGALIAVVILVIAVLAVIRTIPQLSESSRFGLEKSGNYYDNMSEFAGMSGKEQIASLSRAYLENVVYEITDIDKERMIAVVDVRVPDLSDTLPQIVDQVLEENKDADYSSLLASVQSRLESAVRSGKAGKKAVLELPIRREGGSYRLAATEEWNQLIFGGVEELYTECLKALMEGTADEMLR